MSQILVFSRPALIPGRPLLAQSGHFGQADVRLFMRVVRMRADRAIDLTDFRPARLLFSLFQRGSLLFQPRINHRASCNFGVFVRSRNCFLFRQSTDRKINSHAPLPSRDPYPDCVANASMLHVVILDQNWWFICDDHHGPSSVACTPAAAAWRLLNRMSRLRHLADIGERDWHVRFWGLSGHPRFRSGCPFLTQSGHHSCANRCRTG